MIETGHVAVEICLDSLASAFAADRGGADRIELCDQLAVGGVTPTSALVRQIRSAVRCKLHVLIRPRAGDFVYSADDIALMESEIDNAKAQGADGVVLGVLDRSKNIDINATGDLVARARPMSVTFHRAFDHVPNPLKALEAVIATGADRVLTSGGSKPDGTEFARAIDGAAALRALVEAAGKRIIILAGGGIRSANARTLVESSGLTEIHSSLNDDTTRASARAANKFVVHEHRVKDLIASVVRSPRAPAPKR
jgi:copper homeostasis protein